MKTIVYQGVKGAYSYATAIKEFGQGHNYIGLTTFKEVFDLVDSGHADYGLLPIENSLVGSIYENYDLLHQYDMKIVGEAYIKVEHCLLAPYSSIYSKEDRIDSIKKVLSHPKALEQCTSLFRRHPWMEAVVHMDTAGAAEQVSREGNPTCAAIASASAAELYGLEIVYRGIEDDSQNYTRFVTIAKEGSSIKAGDKCSLMLQLNHAPGTLVDVLNRFEEIGVNLTKIESRPMRGSPFEYHFYLDFDFMENSQEEIDKLLEDISQKAQKMKVLGLYGQAQENTRKNRSVRCSNSLVA